MRKPRKCPVCGSNRIADILYGLRMFSEKLMQEINAGKVVLGGCCLGEDDPAWQCADCGSAFYGKRRVG